jgi:chitin disaccharide deacetylase
MKQSKTNHLLGYPEDARLLVVNADDIGMCQAVNEATIRAFREGIVRSCSLMVPCPWRLHAVHLLQETPELSFGIHLTSVSEQPLYRWGPVVCADKVSSLVDEQGYFYSEERIDEFLSKVNLSELEREYRTQIEWVFARGLRPTHLDSHCGIHTRREEIFDMTVALAHEYGLALRVTGDGFIQSVQERGFPVNEHKLMDSYDLAPEHKSARYLEMLRELPVGLSEWAVHPGLASNELKALMPSWEVRQSDFDFLVSKEARDVIRKEGIILLNYRTLQNGWQNL